MVSLESFFVTTQPFYVAYDRLNPFLQYLNPSEGWSLFFARFQRAFVLTSLVYVLVGQLMEISLGYAETGDMVKVTESLAWVIIGIICMCVWWTFYVKSGQITQVIRRLKQIFPAEEVILEQINAAEILLPLTKIMNTFQNFYIFTLVFKLGYPLVELLIEYWTQGRVVFHYPLSVWFPFKITSWPLYITIFLFDSWGIFLSTCPMVVMTAIIGGITSTLSVQFKVLAFEFNSFKPHRGLSHHDVDLQVIKALIGRHCDLIALSEEIKVIFSSFLLGNYIFCSMGLSLFMFVTATSVKQDVIIDFLGNVICFIFYISTLSMFGHRYTEYVRKGVSANLSQFIM